MISRHKGWIGIKTNRSILAIFTRLLFELRHTIEPAQTGNTIKHPCQLRMFGNLALIENDMSFRIDTAGDKGCCDFANA